MLIIPAVLGLMLAMVPLALVVLVVSSTQASCLPGPWNAGPTGGPVQGRILVAQANIPSRSGADGFESSMARVLQRTPDLVSLNEMFTRSIATMEAAAPGYTAWRETTPDTTAGGVEAMSTAVMWRSDTWTRVGQGRVKIVEDDHTFNGSGQGIVVDRFATWVMLQRGKNEVVSFLSVHHMINPAVHPRQHGNPPQSRAQQYGSGMDTLTGLMRDLEGHGPVIVAGDFNTHAGYVDKEWSAVAKMGAAGYQSANTGLDYVFYPSGAGVRLVARWDGPMASDHRWLLAELEMGGAAPASPAPLDPREGDGLTPAAANVITRVRAQFGEHTFLGVGERSSNPESDHSSGKAVDVMIEDWSKQAGVAEGDAIAAWVVANADELAVNYVIWRARIWSSSTPTWREYSHPSGLSSPTLDHFDHVHVSVADSVEPVRAVCAPVEVGGVVFPVPEPYAASDAHNWGKSGDLWAEAHTGTDFSAPCGTAVYASTAGTVEIDTTAGWAGPQLVKVVTAPQGVATWYAHLETVTVPEGVVVVAGQQIGTVGELGNTTGCHLHFEVHLANGPIYGEDNVDPSTWLEQMGAQTLAPTTSSARTAAVQFQPSL